MSRGTLGVVHNAAQPVLKHHLQAGTEGGQEGALGAHVMRGKEYIAPSVKVQSTPSRPLKKSVIMCALRRRLSSRPSFSAFQLS